MNTTFARAPVEVDGDERLWRYMSAMKLFALISKQQLFLSRCDGFDDPFEGSLGPAHRRDEVIGALDSLGQHIGDAFAEHGKAQLTSQSKSIESTFEIPPKLRDSILKTLGSKELMAKWIASQMNTHLREDLTDSFKSDFRRTFISCWHASQYESEAMWRLYAKDTTECVAIRTSAFSLIRSLQQPTTAKLFRVVYEDSYVYSYDEHPLYRFCTKRLSFEHEREVRLIRQFEHRDGIDAKAIQLRTELSTLIHELIVSPYAAPWVAETISEFCSRFSVTAKVSPSQLSLKAFHE
jgi:hypothetical protein